MFTSTGTILADMRVNHEINIMKVDEFKRNYSSQGITRLDLVVDGTKRCG
jgi:hypothetical protein